MKTFKPRFQFLKYLFWLAPLFVIMGVVAGIVSGVWGTVPLSLIIAGVVIFVLWLVFLGRGDATLQPNFWKRRSTQASTNAVVSTIAVVVILGLLNFLAVRHSTRIDLTEGGLFTLSPESKQVVSALNQETKLWVFDNQQNPQDRQLLENYQRQNQQFKFEFVDPEANPGLAKEFEIKNSGDSRDVYLELPAQQRKQFVQNIGSQRRLSESQVTNGLLQIGNDQQIKVYFLQGHGEKSLQPGDRAISTAVRALGDKSFISEPLNLAQAGTVPTDAAVVLVVGPTRPVLEAEVKALQDYLNRGGNLFVAVDPAIKSGLESLLGEWGVKLDDRVAINAPQQQVLGVGPAGLIVTQYGAHPITKEFGNGYSFYPLARPLDINPVAGVQNTPLLLTDPNSWAESNLKEQPLKLDGGDRPGPLTIGVALTRSLNSPPAPSPSLSPSPVEGSSPSPSPDGSALASPSPSPSPSISASPSPSPSSKESRLVVLGNSSFVADSYFEQQLNGDVFLNSVNWLSQEGQQPLSLRPKDIKNRRITLNTEQATILALMALAIVPLFGFLTSGILWWRRR
ncbi:GldG family protein [Myxacorys almedinensis]|uniref:ABC transporter n=1 Tax=Myxacorys almedinensis A TaxID=2690445 RepID=A0A8J7Z743_9CYAN|nr:Gldg family protein [Myxacorys almedinensis]NDJ19366.1 ABC transporter [Myxacorys almedinensis A]